MIEDYVAAIRQRRTLLVNYAPGAREIEPHAVGVGADGQHLLRAFQTDGASASGEHINWKLFRLDRFGGPPKLAGKFPGPRPGYRRGDSAMKRGIIEEL